MKYVRTAGFLLDLRRLPQSTGSSSDRRFTSSCGLRWTRARTSALSA
jgi:hypothetical protein